jgi:enhancing lycopene biosynthesis protein 2
MKIAILLSGCGVFDGAEIQESVLTMLAIQESGSEYICIALNKEQHHVINHLDGSEMQEKRNMLVEAARIARGEIKDLETINFSSFDAVVIPGGFGNAKSLSSWALDGPKGTILPEIKSFILKCIELKKPIAALCVSPVLISKALENTSYHPILTMGTTLSPSHYSIQEFHEGLKSIGSDIQEKDSNHIQIDENLKIVSAPCYMMDINILTLRNNIKMAIDALIKL